jgi:integrase
MTRIRLQQSGDLYLQGGFWKLCWREEAIDANGSVERHFHKPTVIGPATGPHGVTKEEAQRIAWENLLSRPKLDEQPRQSPLTIAEFVERVFIPEHVAMKAASGRTHFRAILKHVLTPDEVDRVFHIDAGKSRTKLKAVPNWPYLGSRRLAETRPEDVQRLIAAAVTHGYSAQTVKHIRNVVGAIFTHARKGQCFSGDNPAELVTLPRMVRKEAPALTLVQAKDLLSAMQYPERELALIAMLTRMNVAEICGLQWKWVNLTDDWSEAEGERIPPRTIAVRRHFYLGELASLPVSSRKRDLSIPDPLLSLMRELSQRPKYTRADDFVLVSRVGTPIDETAIAKRRLKPIGRRMQMPWLSWRVFSRTHTQLAHQLGMQSLDRMAMPTFSAELHASGRGVLG